MNIYAKSFIALDSDQHLIDASTAQLAPYDRYTCHLCGSPLVFHPEWVNNRPWFEHIREELTENGLQHCPYVHPEPQEIRLIRKLRRYIPDVVAVVRKTDWHCSDCGNDYHGERYCSTCRTGDHSIELNGN